MWSNGLTIWWTQNPCTGYREPERDSFLVGAEKSFPAFFKDGFRRISRILLKA